ncbi:MAG TPA: ABC transporter permease [Anaerolineaceae bacterium]
MITDIITIIGKEFKEIFLLRGSFRSTILNLLIIVGLAGIFFPAQMGTTWLTNPTGLLTWSWLPLFLVMGVVADSFAGERERHTLETLLASRLPDRAILFGKICAAVLYGWGMAVVTILLGAITVNVMHPGEGVRFYPLNSFLTAVALSFLAALLISSIGVLVSLHSATTRQAYQKMSMGFLIIWFIPLLLQFLPESITRPMIQSLAHLNLGQVMGGLLTILVVANIVMLFLAVNRFRRDRLILD